MLWDQIVNCLKFCLYDENFENFVRILFNWMVKYLLCVGKWIIKGVG